MKNKNSDVPFAQKVAILQSKWEIARRLTAERLNKPDDLFTADRANHASSNAYNADKRAIA